MTKRRTFIKSAGALGTAGLIAGCLGGGGGGDDTTEGDGGTDSGSDDQPFVDGKLKMLMSPTEPQEQMRAQYAPIGDRLEEYVESVDGNVELQYARNYAAALTALGSGTADVAETGPFAAALGVKDDSAEVILQRKGYGSWTYSSVFVTREEMSDEISSLSDVEGKKVAFADPLSASGSLYPLAMLKEAGLSVPDSPGTPAGADFEPTWSSHATAFQTVMQGNADIAGVGRFITLNEAREYKDGVVEVKREKGIPRAPIVVSPKLSDDEQETIRKAFTEAGKSLYDGEDGEAGTDDDLWFSDVRQADVEAYQPVIDKAETLGYGAEIFGE